MKLTTLLVAGAAVIGLAAAHPVNEARDDCNHSWCGAPFCYPECGPNGKEKRDVEEKRQVQRADEPTADKKCNHGWCGAPFCYPECGPNGKEKRDVEEKRQIQRADEATADKKCNHGWCGAPFCYPECAPSGGVPSEEAKLKAREAAAQMIQWSKAEKDTAEIEKRQAETDLLKCDNGCENKALAEVKAREEATADKKCNHGWCGAPFCYPECGPNGKRAVELHA